MEDLNLKETGVDDERLPEETGVDDERSSEGSLPTSVILQVLRQLDHHGYGDKTVAEVLQQIGNTTDSDLVLPPQPVAEVTLLLSKKRSG